LYFYKQVAVMLETKLIYKKREVLGDSVANQTTRSLKSTN